MAETGHNRTINRQKFWRADLEQELADPASLRYQVFAAYRRLLEARASSSAFHPHGNQRVLFLSRGIFALLRTSPGGDDLALCLHNVSDQDQTVTLSPGGLGIPAGVWHCLFTDEAFSMGEENLTLSLRPYGVRWLRTWPHR